MARLATSKNLRVGCWTAAGCGIVGSLVFFNCYPYSSLSFFPIKEFGKDVLPYLVVAVAAALCRRLAPAAVSLVASFSILALGVFTHLDLMKYNYLNVCTPTDAEQQQLKAALTRLPAAPKYNADFEISRGRTSLQNAEPARYLRLRRELLSEPSRRWLREGATWRLRKIRSGHQCRAAGEDQER